MPPRPFLHVSGPRAWNPYNIIESFFNIFGRLYSYSINYVVLLVITDFGQTIRIICGICPNTHTKLCVTIGTKITQC